MPPIVSTLSFSTFFQLSKIMINNNNSNIIMII